MPNCKICGKPVKAAPVVHERCLNREFERLQEEFCDNYCRLPAGTEDADKMDEACGLCPMNRLHQLIVG